MKKPLLFSSLLLSFNSIAGIQIISDLDDTIKITNSGNIWESIGYGSVRRKVYSGMPEFLAGTEKYASRLNVISSSPEILKFQVKNLLKKHDIKTDEIVLNSNFKRPGHFEYKTNAIKKLMDATTDSFILMGDDVGEDPEIYDAIMREYPDRVLANYIHIVKNREVPETAIKYYTTFDLALKENQAGRLGDEDVRAVIRGILADDELEGVFPEFAYCPTEKANYTWQIKSEFSEEAMVLGSKLIDYCIHEWDD